jgi:RNA polymerase sigma factor (TIGR02999 family)
MSPATRDVTQLLQDWRGGSVSARDELLGLVYDELRKLASGYLRRERPDHTLQPTALVHEAYLQLIDQSRVSWESRAHFFGVAANLMRRILVDHARAHNAQKRGSGDQMLALDEALNTPAANKDLTLLALDDALNELARLDELQSRLVELRYFGGLTIEETAEALDISPATVKREWTMAKHWLQKQIEESE